MKKQTEWTNGRISNHFSGRRSPLESLRSLRYSGSVDELRLSTGAAEFLSICGRRSIGAHLSRNTHD